MIKYKRFLQLIAPYYDYRHKAKKDATFPYRVLTGESMPDDETASVINFDIDYWDRAQTDENIRTMIEDCDLDGHIFYVEGSIGFHVFCTAIIPLDDPDIDLRRMKLSFQARVFFGGTQ